MAVASLFFALMSATVRFANDLPVHTLAFFRFAFGAVVIALLAAGRVIELRLVNRRFLFWRGLLGGMAVYLYYLAICRVGLAKGTVLSYTYPIFVPLFGAVVLRERVPLRVAAAIPAAFFGVYGFGDRTQSGALEDEALGIAPGEAVSALMVEVYRLG